MEEWSWNRYVSLVLLMMTPIAYLMTMTMIDTIKESNELMINRFSIFLSRRMWSRLSLATLCTQHSDPQSQSPSLKTGGVAFVRRRLSQYTFKLRKYFHFPIFHSITIRSIVYHHLIGKMDYGWTIKWKMVIANYVSLFNCIRIVL